MEEAGSVSVRRQMLGEWVRDWSDRHEASLARERSLIPVRAGRQTFLVTASEAEAALGRTHDELFQAFGRRSDWGVDERGRPSSRAVRGLATRRLADRLRDALRARNGRLRDHEMGEWRTESDARFSASAMDSVGAMLAVKQALAGESPTTREIVLRRAMDETAVETAAALGIEPAAVRQRLARFIRRNIDLAAA